jgi:hypothetical protein
MQNHALKVQGAIRSLLAALARDNKMVSSPGQSPTSSDSDNNGTVEEGVDSLMTALDMQARTAEQHLNALPHALAPILPLQFLNWAMSQNDKFYSDPSGLWSSVFRHEIGASEQQMAAIVALRDQARRQQLMLNPNQQGSLQDAYTKVSGLLRAQMASASHFAHLRTILTPHQIAKFCEWVERFGHVCVMINV